MTISDLIEILLPLEEIRSEGYTDHGGILLDLAVIEARDFPGDQPLGTIRIQGEGSRALTDADRIDTRYMLVVSTPHLPQLNLYLMVNLEAVEAHILGPSGPLNTFCGMCVVIKDRLPLRFQIRFQDQYGEETVFVKEQHRFETAFPGARVEWLA